MDDDDTVLGAFVALSRRNTAEQGPGNMSSGFLWPYSNTKLSVYKTTGRNDYIALCEPDYLNFGGGDSRMGCTLTRACWRARWRGV